MHECLRRLQVRQSPQFAVDQLLLLMATMTPHITAELWEQRHGSHIHEQPWPIADPAMVTQETATMVVQKYFPMPCCAALPSRSATPHRRCVPTPERAGVGRLRNTRKASGQHG